MADITRKSKRDIVLREKAKEITVYIPQKAWRAQINAIFEFVRDHIRYIHDIRGIETIQWPRHTLETLQGDCDDKCTLLATLLETVGHRTRFRAMGFRPNRFSHVIVETKLGRGWVSLDATEPYRMGWRPTGMPYKMLEHV